MIAKVSNKKMGAPLLQRRMDNADLIVKVMEELGGVSVARRTTTEAGWRRRTEGEVELEQRRPGIKCQRRGSRYFFASRERKEAGTMPSAAGGAASPWFISAGSDLVSLKYLLATTSGSRTDRRTNDVYTLSDILDSFWRSRETTVSDSQQPN